MLSRENAEKIITKLESVNLKKTSPLTAQELKEKSCKLQDNICDTMSDLQDRVIILIENFWMREHKNKMTGKVIK